MADGFLTPADVVPHGPNLRMSFARDSINEAIKAAARDGKTYVNLVSSTLPADLYDRIVRELGESGWCVAPGLGVTRIEPKRPS